ncbi:MAG: hypothetical protein MUP86_02755 [Dehalococcoidia bacterium]|nr:hypothetical protein [Dehalococcoidia bacterium]
MMIPMLIGAGASVAGGALDAYGQAQSNSALRREAERQASQEQAYQRAMGALAMQRMGQGAGVQGFVAARDAASAPTMAAMQRWSTLSPTAGHQEGNEAYGSALEQGTLNPRLEMARRLGAQKAAQDWAQRLQDMHGDQSFEARLMQARRALWEGRNRVAAGKGAAARMAGGDMQAMGRALMEYDLKRAQAAEEERQIKEINDATRARAEAEGDRAVFG